MPRQPRLELPGIPVHVTQRGVNRAAIFIDDDDRRHYLRLLRHACKVAAVSVHAFVLMDNHVHLLLSASVAGAVSDFMRCSGQAYVQAFNARHGRCGSLWQGRFKSSLVDTDGYLLQVLRYIELNPVRAAMVAQPEDFRWSSVNTHLGLGRDPLVTPHAGYLGLGATADERVSAYRDWLYAPINNDDHARIRRHVEQERALGNPRFQEMVAKALNRPVHCRSRGRPAKQPAVGL